MSVVLSAYLSDEVLHNAHDWGSSRKVQMVIQREAQNPGNWRWRWIMLLDRRSRFPESSRTSRFSFLLTNLFPTDIQAELHLPSGVTPVFVGRKELERTEPNDFRTRFLNNFGYIAVSHIGLNLTKSEAIFYVDHFCGLCGGGGYVVMRKVNGQWRVVEQHSTWVSSLTNTDFSAWGRKVHGLADGEMRALPSDRIEVDKYSPWGFSDTPRRPSPR